MDVFNRLITQLNDLFKSMSPGARITAGLLLVAVVVSIGYLFNAQTSGAEAYLLNGQSFTADDMSRMEGAFGKAGLSDYTVEGSRIKIAKSRQAAFLGALADAGAMPAHFGSYLTTAASNSGPFTSRDQREEIIKVAKQNELALVIRSMNGVENASVQYDSMKTPGFNKAPTTTASVGVKMSGQLPLTDAQVMMIRSLVASSIAGLPPDNVTIADLNGGRTYSAKSGPGGNAMDDAYLSRVREYQNLFENKIRDQLAGIPGVLVTAHVDLDREILKRVTEHKVEQKPVTIVEKTVENSSNSTAGGGPGGRVGLQAQQPNSPGALPNGGSGSSHKEDTISTVERTSAPSHGQTTTEIAGLTPKKVSVSIGIPSDYFEKVWAMRNPTPVGQEAKKPDQAALTAIQDEEVKRIRETVKNLIPTPTEAPPGFDLNQLISVTSSPRVSQPEPVGPSLMNNVLDWLAASWSSVAMIGLALMALMMLRSFVSAVPAAPELPSVMSTTIAEEEQKKADEAAAVGGEAKDGKSKLRSLQRKVGTGPSLREELVDMVREDPEAAANILRGWIGSTS